MSRLEGKRAVITGASSGIGRGIALRFAAEGAAVAACGRDAARTAATCEEITRRGGTAVGLTGDVSREEEARSLVERAVAALGGVDVLVNNAGIGGLKEGWFPVHETPVELWDKIIAVNLRGAFLMSKFTIPRLLEAGGGSILYISSIFSTVVWPGDGAYNISKAALNMLSNQIAVEYGSGGIRSNTLMPAVIVTEDQEALMASPPEGGALRLELLAKHPVNRFGTIEEVADAAVFLCSAEAAFLTGAAVPIDGGYSRT